MWRVSQHPVPNGQQLSRSPKPKGCSRGSGPPYPRTAIRPAYSIKIACLASFNLTALMMRNLWPMNFLKKRCLNFSLSVRITKGLGALASPYAPPLNIYQVQSTCHIRQQPRKCHDGLPIKTPCTISKTSCKDRQVCDL